MDQIRQQADGETARLGDVPDDFGVGQVAGVERDRHQHGQRAGFVLAEDGQEAQAGAGEFGARGFEHCGVGDWRRQRAFPRQVFAFGDVAADEADGVAEFGLRNLAVAGLEVRLELEPCLDDEGGALFPGQRLGVAGDDQAQVVGFVLGRVSPGLTA